MSRVAEVGDRAEYTPEQEATLEEMLGAARRVASEFSPETPWGSAARMIAIELSSSLPPQPSQPLQRVQLDRHPSRSTHV